MYGKALATQVRGLNLNAWNSHKSRVKYNTHGISMTRWPADTGQSPKVHRPGKAKTVQYCPLTSTHCKHTTKHECTCTHIPQGRRDGSAVTSTEPEDLGSVLSTHVVAHNQPSL